MSNRGGAVLRAKTIRLAHGGGGRLTAELIQKLFVPMWRNPSLEALGDSAVLEMDGAAIALTTDSYVVSPPFFPGGDIGTLAICGTVNDLAVAGAEPKFLTCGLILEEGFPVESLERIVASMKTAAEQAGVQIVTGDTKVVGKGKGDGVFINTAGVGPIRYEPLGPAQVRPDDQVLLSGMLGDHGLAVLKARGEFALDYEIESDCAALGGLIESFLAPGCGVRFMRDPTRGGLAAALCELTAGQDWGIELLEEAIPVRPPVAGLCEVLGYDPLTVANEGKVVVVVSPEQAPKVFEAMKAHPLGKDTAHIGQVVPQHPGKVCLQTTVGGTRVLDVPLGEDLPRIC